MLASEKSKTLSGIETPKRHKYRRGNPRRKNPKTLSGIETAKAKLLDRILPVVGKTLKPYQGLKPDKPSANRNCCAPVGKTLKPYQGLKLTIPGNIDNCCGWNKNPKTLSGIETTNKHGALGPSFLMAQKP